jgi:hypothetical protein
VPQVYLGAPSQPPAGVQFAVRQLSQFARVTLAAGESRWVSVEVPLRQFQFWSAADQQWQVAGGRRAVYVGDADSAGQLALQAAVDIPSQANVTCDDAQLSATMVSGRLTVPRGSWCDLVDVSVAGDARISGLRIAGSTIGGDLDILGTQDAADPLSAQAKGNTIDRNLVCTHNAGLASSHNTVKGRIRGRCGQ